MSGIAVRYGELSDLNVEVLSISVDSVHTHKVWNETELIKMAGMSVPFPMLSDETGNIGKLYDVYDVQTGKDLRGTFIIDPTGYVHGSEILTSPVGRNIDEIIRQVKAFQLYISTGQTTPCNWAEGGKTIMPSIDKAGQVWKEWRTYN